MGAYISQTDLENEFGANNIAEWSNRDSDGTGVNTTVVANAIGYAETYVEDRFRTGPYVIPFVATVGSLYVVKDWCMKIAADKLYRGRPPGTREHDRFASLLEGIESEMDKYLAGQRNMNAAKMSPGTTTMTVMVPCNEN